jgi:hypothetical protein
VFEATEKPLGDRVVRAFTVPLRHELAGLGIDRPKQGPLLALYFFGDIIPILIRTQASPASNKVRGLHAHHRFLFLIQDF